MYKKIIYEYCIAGCIVARLIHIQHFTLVIRLKNIFFYKTGSTGSITMDHARTGFR